MPLLSEHTSKSISVIIPTYRDDKALRGLLRQLDNHDVREVIIIDGEGRKSAPDGLGILPSIKWLTAPRGRGPQIAYGLSVARGDYLWVLHADAQIHTDSLSEIRRILDDSTTALGMFRLCFNHPRWAYRLFEGFARLDMPLSSFGDQGFFFRRDALLRCPALLDQLIAAPILEDVILRKNLKALGGVKKSHLKIGTSPRRFERHGLWRMQYLNAVILLKARFGAPPHVLYRKYYARPAHMASHDNAAAKPIKS